MVRLLLGMLVLVQACGYGCADELPRQPKTDFVSVSGSDLIGSDGAPIHLRGISFANWLVPEGYMFNFDTATSPREIKQVISELVGEETSNAFWSEWRDNFISEDDLSDIKRMGFNLIESRSTTVISRLRSIQSSGPTGDFGSSIGSLIGAHETVSSSC